MHKVQIAPDMNMHGAPAHRGPSYSADTVRDIDDFTVQLLRDLASNGVSIGQLYAETTVV